MRAPPRARVVGNAMATGGDESPSLAAWLAEIGAPEALGPLRNEEFETVAALRDLTGKELEEGLADIEGTSVTRPPERFVLFLYLSCTISCGSAVANRSTAGFIRAGISPEHRAAILRALALPSDSAQSSVREPECGSARQGQQLSDEDEELLAEEEYLEDGETEAAAPFGPGGSQVSGQPQSPQPAQQQQLESQKSDSDSDENSSSDSDGSVRRVLKLRPRVVAVADVPHAAAQSVVPVVPDTDEIARSAPVAADVAADSDDEFEEQLDMAAEPHPVELASTMAASIAAAVAAGDADATQPQRSAGVRSLGRVPPPALSKIESDMQKMIQLRKAKNRAARMQLARQNAAVAARVAAADGA